MLQKSTISISQPSLVFSYCSPVFCQLKYSEKVSQSGGPFPLKITVEHKFHSSCNRQSIEMIYRGSCSLLSLFLRLPVCRLSVLLREEGGGGLRGGRGAKAYDHQKSLALYKIIHTLWLPVYSIIPFCNFHRFLLPPNTIITF